MAAHPETSFSSLLRADSDQPLPDDDAGVIAALTSYGAVFKKTKAAAPARLNLLAGLMWVHAHQADLHIAWPAASVAQHRTLAQALRLDYDELSKTGPWLTMIVRRVLANIQPGATPEKRKAPGNASEGQIRKPGGDLPPPPIHSAGAAPKRRRLGHGQPHTSAAAKDSASSSSSSDPGATSGSEPDQPVVILDSPAPLAEMPTMLGAGIEFSALVTARCLQAWVPLSAVESSSLHPPRQTVHT
jgi:hypothetical protein